MKLVLAEFNSRVGNQVVWTSKDVKKQEIGGIEFQMIPSGLHEVISDTIYFTAQHYAGVAVFLARTGQSQQRGERPTMRVYSLAVLDSQVPYKLETWLRALLEKYIVVNDVAILEKANEPFADPAVHPVLAANEYMQLSGPLLYELWKASISRQRLIINCNGFSVKKLSQFCYLTSILGSIPSDLANLIPATSASLEYPCLYNVTLLDTQRLRSLETFCACTTDLLLTLPDRDICDIVLGEQGLRKIDGTRIQPTWRDRHRFNLNAEQLCPSYTSKNHPLSYVFDRLTESTVQGLLWWASAGDISLVSEPGGSPICIDQPDIEGVVLVGLFHNYTRQLFEAFAALANEFEGNVMIGVEDIVQMGLDPLSGSDCQFLQQFAAVWFGREIKFKHVCCTCLC